MSSPHFGARKHLFSVRMNRLGFKSVVYHGDVRLGELDVIPVKGQNFQFPNNEIRIRHITPRSERCPPMSVLQTLSSYSVRCKLESSLPIEQPHLINLHAACFYELKVLAKCILFYFNLSLLVFRYPV